MIALRRIGFAACKKKKNSFGVGVTNSRTAPGIGGASAFAPFLSSSSSISTSTSTSSTDTYYDSQSGMHIPVHDERKISLYWNALSSSNTSSKTSDNNNNSNNSLQTGPIDSGIMAGALVDDSAQQNDAPGLTFVVPPPGFTVCTRIVLPSLDDDDDDTDVDSTSSNVLLEYRNDNDSTMTLLQKALSGYIANNIPTSLGLIQKSLYEQDPILVAADIGTVMDGVVRTGADWVWLIPAHSDDDIDDDAIVALCQELAYLDLTGPTMKSRLVVQASSEDQVEECLMMGISKFVISSSSGNPNDEEAPPPLDWVKDIVEEQGKELCFLPTA